MNMPPPHLQGISAKMGLDATRPMYAAGHVFNRVRIPGEHEVDLGRVIVAEGVAALAGTPLAGAA